jgi:hypothetical protein
LCRDAAGGWRPVRGSLAAVHVPLPAGAIVLGQTQMEDAGASPVQQAERALQLLEAAWAGGRPGPAREFMRELDASMQRIGQLTHTISLLENLRRLLQSSCQ